MFETDDGPINWVGLKTLYLKEVHRFSKVLTQTVVAPMVMTLLFLAIFNLALGRGGQLVGGVAFSLFLAPGLIMMGITQNAFANTSSSILISKIQGNIVDVLMPPLSAGELMVAYVSAGVTRGLIVAVAVGLVMLPFVPLTIHNGFAVVYFAAMASLMMALIGLITGLWADKFDHLAAVTNFVVTPLSFLSGTFYSVERLPEFGQWVAFANPFFYVIDGFRFGFIGHSDSSVALGAAVILGVDAALWLVAHGLIRRGYKLKT